MNPTKEADMLCIARQSGKYQKLSALPFSYLAALTALALVACSSDNPDVVEPVSAEPPVTRTELALSTAGVCGSLCGGTSLAPGQACCQGGVDTAYDVDKECCTSHGVQQKYPIKDVGACLGSLARHQTPQPDGCSVQGALFWTQAARFLPGLHLSGVALTRFVNRWKAEFNDSCDKHDECYQSCENAPPRAKCDSDFFQSMSGYCRANYARNPAGFAQCELAASGFYEAVWWLAASAWEDDKRTYCDCCAGDASCTCVPKTCAEVGASCGTADDTCGGKTPNCGSCTSPDTCGGGGVQNQCGCTPKTCAQLGANCDQADDQCGGKTANCGSCTPPDTCGGSGIANQCGSPACPPGTTWDVATQHCGGELLAPSDSDGYSFVIFTVPSNVSSATITADVTWASDWYPPPPNETTQSGPNLVEVPFNGGSGCDHVWKHPEDNFVNFDIDPSDQNAEKVGSISVGPGKSVAIAGSDCYFGDNFTGNHLVKWWVTLNP